MINMLVTARDVVTFFINFIEANYKGGKVTPFRNLHELFRKGAFTYDVRFLGR